MSLKVAIRISHLQSSMDCLVKIHEFGIQMQLSLPWESGGRPHRCSLTSCWKEQVEEMASSDLQISEALVHTSDTRRGFTVEVRKIIFCVLRKIFFSFSSSFGQEGL